MRVFLLSLSIGLVAQIATPQTPAAGPATYDEKIIYSVGLSIYRSLSQFDLSPAELQLIKRALDDAAAGKPAVDVDEWGPKIEALAKTRGGRVADREKV